MDVFDFLARHPAIRLILVPRAGGVEGWVRDQMVLDRRVPSDRGAFAGELARGLCEAYAAARGWKAPTVVVSRDNARGADVFWVVDRLVGLTVELGVNTGRSWECTLADTDRSSGFRDICRSGPNPTIALAACLRDQQGPHGEHSRSLLSRLD